jgi:hypothetical protein
VGSLSTTDFTDEDYTWLCLLTAAVLLVLGIGH